MQVPKSFKPHPLLALLTTLGAMGTSSLVANPQGAQVVNGQVTMVQNGSTLTVTNTPGAIINWQQFNIGRGELTRFVQQSAASQVLNRVVGVNPSSILGTLQSNGRVFLINPNGIVFGAGSQVDVAGLVASTLRLSNDDFLNQRLRFTDTPGAGAIKNEGTLRSALGGEILLIAPRIENSGLIHSPEGKILLAAGRSVEVADIDKPGIRVEITNTDEQAVNLGTLMARHISIYGALVRNAGRIQATSATVGDNGKVVLRATQKVELTPSSVIEATGAAGTTGGEIDISASNTLGLNGGGEVLVQGVLSVRPVLEPSVPSAPSFLESNRPQVPINTVLLATTNIATSNQSSSPASNLVTGTTNLEGVPAPSSSSGVNANPQVLPAHLTPGPTDPVAPAPSALGASPLSAPVVPTDSPARPEPYLPALPASPTGPTSPAPSPMSSGAGNGVGGNIRVSARGRVVVGEGAVLDASGPNGGGSIMVGGGWQGLNPNIINSQFTYIASTATLYANADLRGNGGLVVVWANDTARIYGHLAARGGALGGNGGNIETSGKRMLDVTQVADASAPNGNGGLWLLDPNNVIIQTTGSDTNVTGNPNFTTTADSAIITTATIQAALNAGINVTITTSAGGVQNGDITISNAISKTSGGNATLTLSAHNNININAGISSTTGTLGLVLNANSDAAGGGTATLGGSATLALNGGSITSSNASALTWASGTLNNVNVGLNATVTGTVFITNNLTLSGGAVITIGNSANLQYSGNNTISGSGTIDLSGNSAQIYRNTSNTSLTIGSGVTVQATGSNTSSNYLGLYSDETIILSTGAIWNVNNSAKTWYTGNLQNQGTINVSAGGAYLGPYSGNGTFSNNGGTINLSGATSTFITLGRDNGDTIQSTNLGTINQTGGTAYVNGTLALGGNPLNLSTVGLTGLVLNNSGGNSVVTGTTGNLLTANTGFNLSMASGNLSNVNLGTNLAVTGTGYFSGNLDLAAGTTVTLGNNANFVYVGNTTVSGSGTIDLAGNNAQIYRNTSNTSLTIGSGVTVQATGSNTSSTYLGLYSDETIILSTGAIWNVNNAAKTWYTGNLQNQGTINVSAGGAYLGPYSGNGTFSNNGGTINLSGATSTFITLGRDNGDTIQSTNLGTINQTGGTAYVNGTLALGGNPLNLSTVGLTGLVLNNSGGNSVVTGTTGNLLTANTGFNLSMASGNLSNVNLGTNLAVTGTGYFSGNLDLAAGTTVTLGNNANFVYVGNTTVSGSGTIDLAGNNAQIYRNTSNTSLTIGSGVTVQATGSNTSSNYLGLYSDETIILSTGAIWNVNNSAKTWYTGNLQNQGTINVSAGGAYLGPYSGNGTFSNNGGTINLSGATSTFITLGRDNGDTIQSTNLGTINQTGGTAYVNGTLALGGNPLNLSTVGLTGLVLNNSGGNSVVTGTTGNLLTANTGFNLSMASGNLSNVNLGTNLAVTGTGYFSGNLDLAAGTTVTLGNNANFVYVGNTTVSGSGTIDLAGNNAQIYRNTSNTSLTIGSGVTVQATGSNTSSTYLGLYSDETIILSTGAIWNVNNAAKTWYTGNLQNQGTINVSAGGAYLGPYSGNGTFSNNGGTINLSGATSTFITLGRDNGDTIQSTNLGTINQTGGTAYVNGTLALGGNPLNLSTVGLTGLVLNNSGGNSVVTGTTGNLLTANTGFNLSMASGNLSNVNLGTNLAVTGTGYFSGNLDLAAGTTVTLGNNANFVYVGNTTVSGSGTIDLAGNNAQIYRNTSNTSLTIGSGVTVQATGSNTSSTYLGLYSDETIILSTGAIWNVNNAAKTWYTGNLQNQGTINVSAGALNLGAYSGTGPWSSTSPINLSGGTLTVTDNYTAASLATIVKTGGTLNVAGTLDNTGNTLDVATLVGGVFSGSITGGTIISTDGTVLTTASTPYLDGVTLGNAGNLNLTINGGLYVRNSITLANGATVDKGNGTWYWNTTGAQTLAVAGGGNATLISSGGSHYAGWAVTGQTLTFASGLTQQGNISIYDSSAATVINNGTISQSLAATTSTITVTNFSNAAGGTLSTSAGTTTQSSTNWSNAGTLSVSGGIMNLSGTNGINTGGFNLSGGVLNLGGNLSTPVLGSFTRTGGLVNITGILNNTGQTLNIGSAGVFSTGGLNNVSGTILGGTIISTDGTVLTTASTPYLDGVTLGNAGNLNLTINGGLYVRNSITLANGATVDKGNGTWYWNTTGAQTLAVAGGGNATLISSGGSHYAGWAVTGQTLTFASGLTQQGNISIYDSSAATVINNGTISQSLAATTSTITVTNFSNAAGGTLSTSAGTTTQSSTNWSNAGTLSVSGGIMNLSGTNGINTGGFNLSGGVLNLGGNLSTPVLGSFTRTGGLVNITGILNNTGQTLNIGSAGVFSTGGLNNVSGTILGGTIISTDGTVLTTASTPYLDGVTLGNAGNLNLTINGGLYVRNSITLANGATVDKGNGTWYWNTTGAQTLAVAGGGNATLISSGGSHYAGWAVTGQTLTFASGLTQQGNISIYDSSAATVINNGTISQSLAATTSTITVTNFSNAAGGTLSTSAGTTTQSSTNWSNAGTLSVSGGIMNLSGTNGINTGGFNLSGGVLNLGGNLSTPVLGSFTRTGGLVNITGILNNTGQTLNIGSAGVFSTGGLNNVSGTILGGTIISTDGTVLTTASTPYLDGVTLGNAGNLNLTINGGLYVRNSITLANGATVDKGNGTWYWNTTGAQTLAVAGGGNATLISSGGSHYAGWAVTGQTLTFASGLTQQGNISIYDSSAATVINNGTLNFNVAGTSIIQPTTFTNKGTLTLVSGAVLTSNSGTTFTNTGTLQTAGSINMGSGTLTNNGIFRPGASPGFASITGNLVLGAGSTLDIEMAGLARGVVTGYDSMHVTGTVTLGGTVNVSQTGGFVSTVGDLFQIITSGGAMSGSFATIVPPSAPETFVQGTAGNNAFLQRGAAFNGPKVWNTDSSGAWTTASNWSGGTVPTASDTVWIDRGPLANPVVSISGTAVAGKIVAGEGITLSSGSLTVNGASTLSGPLTVNSGTLTLNANMDLTGTYTQTGGTVGGAGNLTLNAVSNTWSGAAGSWTGGGTVTVANGATFSLSGSTVGNVFAGHTLNIASGATVNVAGNIELDPGTNAIVNSGTLNLNSGDIRHTQNSQGGMTITNNGVINKANNNTFILGSSPVAEAVNITNPGTLNVNAGTLNYAGGTGTSTGIVNVASGATWQTSGSGNWQLSALSTFASAGNILSTGGTLSFLMPTANFSNTGNLTNSGGTLTFTPDASLPSIAISGGTTSFNGNANTASFTQSAGTLGGIGNLTLTGVSNTWSGTLGYWSGGGSVTVASGATLNLSGSVSGNTFAGRTLNISAGGTVNIAGNVELDPGTNAINNAGTLNLNSGDIRHTQGSQGSLTLTNTGVINKSNAGTFILGSAPVAEAVNVNNNGVINLTLGTLNYTGGALTQSGTLSVGAGTTFTKLGGFTNDGILTGAGTVDVTGATLTNGGTIRPDGGGVDPTGTLSVTGNFVQTAGGTLDFQVENNTAGNFDKLAISGTANLGGTLAFTPTSGYVTNNAHTFDAITYTSATGSFATVNAPAFASFAPTIGATKMTFGLASGCVVDDCWIGTSGDWSVGANWSTGFAPTAGQRVRISVAGLQTITMTAGTFNLVDVISDENITIAGGNLGISGLFSAPVLNLSSGSVSGAGSFTVSSDFNQTGGTFSPTGSVDLTRSLGGFSIGSLTSSGTIRLVTLGAFDINLNGSLLATNTGLADNAAAISITSGRDILIKSTSNLVTNTSGALVLAAAGAIDLKVNDGGGSIATNAMTAAGNLQLTAGTSIGRSDGDAVSLGAKAIAVTAGTTIGNLGGSIIASTGGITLSGTNGVTVNTAAATLGSVGIQSTSGPIVANALSAGTSITATSAGAMTLGALTSGNGVTTLSATGVSSDIALNGDVNATNAGLLATQAGINITAGRDILIKSTTNLTTLNSGAIKLTAGNNVDLKVNDGGGSIATNAVTAVGNLDITATGGSVGRSDGDVVSLSAANLSLTAGTNIGALGGSITATAGNVSMNAPGSVAFTAVNAAGANGNIAITSNANSITGGTLTAGRNVSLTVNAGSGLVLDAITAGTGGNGLITIVNSGASDITLNGNVQTTNTGLADNAAAISITSGRDILIKSTSNLVTNTSGALVLAASGAVDLKVNDGGGSIATNAMTAAGNLQLTAGTSIGRSDGDAASLGAKAIAVTAGTTIGNLGGSIIASTGGITLSGTNGVTVNTAAATLGSVGIQSTSGPIVANALSAGTSITATSAGALTLGALTSGNGVTTLSATGVSSDIALNGDVNATNAGLLATQAGINITAGRDILIKSTTNLTTLNSGAIKLTAGNNVDLKVNDGGGSIATNAVTAVGNLDITATGGSVGRSDGDVVSLSAANLSLTAGTNIGALGGSITATAGNVSMNAPGSVAFTAVNAAGANGNIAITSNANSITGGTLTAGRNVSLTVNAGSGLVLDAITAGTGGNGLITIVNSGASDITLNGNVQTTNTGLADNAAAISITSGRDILIKSTSSVVTNTSGALVLAAAGAIDLKVNDGGGSIATNAMTAAGNLQLTAGTSIGRSDGDATSLGAKAISVTAGTTIGNLGGSIIASTGGITLSGTNGVTVNTAAATLGSVGIQSTSGPIVANALSAGTSITATSAGALTLGALTSGNGVTTLSATGVSSDIALNGDVNATNAGLLATQAGINITAGRDILIKSTTNFTTLNSGAIKLTASNNVDLKVNDGGGSIATNALTAVGDLVISATSISQSDGNGVTAAGKTIDLAYGTTLASTITLAPVDGLNITKTTGNLTVNSSASTFAQKFNTPGGNIIFAPGASFTGGQITVGGSGSAQFNSGVVTFASPFVSTMPVVVGGATVNINGAAPQVIDGGAWNINSGSLILPQNGASVAAGSSLTVAAGGAVSFATGGTAAFSNAGTVTAGTNLLLPGDFTNLAGATANLTGNTIGGSLFNAGAFNVIGTVTVAGPQVLQQGGVINIPAGATLNTSNAAGTFTWADGTIRGAGTLAFSGGGTFVFGGAGNRVIDGLNFSFNNLTLPNGSLTVRSGSLTLNGATVLPDGVALNLDGGTLTNNGTLDVAGTFGLTGGAFAGSGSLTMSGGSMNLPAGNSVAWSNSGMLTNTGTLNLAGSTITNAIVNQGTINLGAGLVFAQSLVNTGTLVAGSGSTTQFNGGVTQQAGGTLALEGGSVNGNLNITQGVVRGSGTINGDLVVGNATFAPGFSPGSITVNGNLVMSSNSVLNIELGGLTRGSGYDWVNVLGTATLAGVVNVSTYSGFVPPPGSSYTFMNFTSSTGAFASVNFPAIAGLAYSQQAQSLVLSVSSLAVAPTAPAAPLNLPTALVSNPVLVAEDKLYTLAGLPVDLRRTVEKAKSEVEREPDLEVCP